MCWADMNGTTDKNMWLEKNSNNWIDINPSLTETVLHDLLDGNIETQQQQPPFSK